MMNVLPLSCSVTQRVQLSSFQPVTRFAGWRRPESGATSGTMNVSSSLPRRRLLQGIMLGSFAPPFLGLVYTAIRTWSGFINKAAVGLALGGKSLTLDQIIQNQFLYGLHTPAEQNRIAGRLAEALDGHVFLIPAQRDPQFKIRTVWIPGNPAVPKKQDVILYSVGADGQPDDRDVEFLKALKNRGYSILTYQYALTTEAGSRISEVPVNGQKLTRAIEVEKLLDADLTQLLDTLVETGYPTYQIPGMPPEHVILAGRSIGGHHSVRVAMQSAGAAQKYAGLRVACFNMPATMDNALRNLISNESDLSPRELSAVIDAGLNNINHAAAKVNELDIRTPVFSLVQSKVPVFMAQAEPVTQKGKQVGGDKLVGMGDLNSAYNLYQYVDGLTRSSRVIKNRQDPFVYYPVQGAEHDTIFKGDQRVSQIADAFEQFMTAHQSR